VSGNFENSGRAPAPRQPDFYSSGLRILKKFLLGLAFVACVSISSSAFAQSPPPNILIILADDLGYGDVSYNGCPDYVTPNIDSLATNGVWCSSGYVTHPLCSPSRAGLITGRYQQRFGHENNPEVDRTNPRLGLPIQELLLPQMLKRAGYVCGAIGKWHLGNAPNLRPTQRGFDEYFGILEGSHYFNASVLRNDTFLIEHDYLTDAFTREGVSFINRHATEPFFLYLAYNAPHSPYDIPQNYMHRVANITDPDRRIYAAMVTALDDGVGQVLQALQARNLLNKTLIFFLSDNGAPQATFTRNYPLSGYKGYVWEGGIRVPFAVQWTGRLAGGIAYDQPVSALDIVPTVAAAAGVSLPTDRVYDGLNVLPYLAREQVPPQRTLFWRWFGLGPTGPSRSSATIYAVRRDSLKLVQQGGPLRLFNLSTDISESQNLAQIQPGDLASLDQLYGQWNADMIAPLWQVNGTPRRIVLAGDWNGFNKDDLSPPWSLTRIIAPGAQGTPDGLDWFTNTIHVAATSGDTTPGLHSFVIVGGSYSNQWGGATINIDATTSVPWFSGNVLGPTNNITLEGGFYYSFRILNSRLSYPMSIAVMKTSAPPVSVTVAGQTPTVPTSDDSVTVNIVTSHPKPPEERIYLRWTTDTYITSHMVEAAGSGVNYSAVIPVQPAGTSVQYCLTTSTAHLSQVVTSGTIDALTLSTSTNTHFVVAPGVSPTPTPTATPSPTPTPSPTVQVSVQTTPAGLAFIVDGTTYNSTQTFSWASGSSHRIATTSPRGGGTGVRYVWSR
jgi:arylsulfatase A-like enzyme